MALFVADVWNSIISSLISCTALSHCFLIFSQFCSILFLKIVLGGINELQNTELKGTEK